MTGDLHSFQGIGYKEWKPYFQGNASLEQCSEQVKKNSRNFAKRPIHLVSQSVRMCTGSMWKRQTGKHQLYAQLEEWRGNR